MVLVGATADHAARLTGRVLPDLLVGAGPFAAIVGALADARRRGRVAVVCLACDLPWIGADAVGRLLRFAAEHPDAVAIVSVAGRPAYPNGVWPVSSLDVLRGRLEAGERSVQRGIAGLEVVLWDGGSAFVDADLPADLEAPGGGAASEIL